MSDKYRQSARCPEEAGSFDNDVSLNKLRTARDLQPLRIMGEVVEEVEEYKYLGVVIGNRLDWKSNMEAFYKKGMSRQFPKEA